MYLFFSFQRLTELKRQCLEKEERFQNIAGLSTMKTNLEYLKHEMAWAVVIFTLVHRYSYIAFTVFITISYNNWCMIAFQVNEIEKQLNAF